MKLKSKTLNGFKKRTFYSNDIIMKRMLVMFMIMVMAVAYIPSAAVNVYAASAANGGTVLTDSTSDVNSAFGSTAVTSSKSGSTLTITLNSDIKLKSPVVFKQGQADDKVVINLNGYSIYGADGVSGDDGDAAKGKDAIQIAFREFDVTINGAGSIVGGKGAVYSRRTSSDTKSGTHKYGADGGAAIYFLGTGDQYLPSRLEHGLTVTGGAMISGGDGADGTYEDWEYNVDNAPIDKYCSDFVIESLGSFHCGNGGPAISQECSNVGSINSNGSYYRQLERSFAMINIINGSAAGGQGGTFDVGSHMTDDNSIRKAENLFIRIRDKYSARFYPGAGGNGVELYTGRKYVKVDSSGTVKGGNGGTITFDGSNGLTNSVYSTSVYEQSNGGCGLYVAGDTGITNEEIPNITDSSESDYISWNTISNTADCIGVYIKGKVFGGNAQDTTFNCGTTCDGGHAIEYNSRELAVNMDQYDDRDWGLLYADQSSQITGGNGGSSTYENGGDGGQGINTDIDPDYGIFNGAVINGTVTGGKGGSTKGSLEKMKPGTGGCGADSDVYGTGIIAGGASGNALIDKTSDLETTKKRADQVDADSLFAEGIYYDEDREAFVNSGGSVRSGAKTTFTEVNSQGISGKVNISAYTDYPTAETRLTCTAGKPSGYAGTVNYIWRMQTYYKDPINGERTYSSSTDNSNVTKYYTTLRSNEKSFTLDEDAVDQIVKAQHGGNYIDIYCYVLLDNGNYAKSNIVTIKPCKTGYKAPEKIQSAQVVFNNEKSFTVTWKAPSDLDSIDGYKIFRSNQRNSPYGDIELADVKKGEPLKYTYTSGRVFYESYFYIKIYTYNSEDQSDTFVITATVPENLPEGCSHANKRHIEGKEATCTVDGNEEYWKCADCGACSFYDDFSYTLYNENACINKAMGHVYRESITKKATCMTPGVKTLTCRICSDSYTEAIQSMDHDYHETITKKAACTTPGVKTMTCSICSDSYTEAIQATGHDYHETITEKATCTTPGVKTFTCSICSDSYTETIQAKGHDYHETITKQASCMTPGVKTLTCSICSDSCTEAIEKVNHKFSSYVYNEDAGIGADGTETAVCDYGCGTTDTRTKEGSALIQENPFTDVEENAYYTEPVLWAVANKITNGTSATTFSPKATCTRAQIVMFLWNAAGQPDPVSTDNPFTDVVEKDWYYKAVLWAVENKITTGISATTFSPDSACTRAQVVTFQWRAAGQTEPAASANPFTDVKAGSWYLKAVLWAVENKITNGISATTFGPDAACTRGQIVTFLYRQYK